LEMLNFALTDGLQAYIGRKGGANSLLFYGAKTTPQMRLRLTFQTPSAGSSYVLRMSEAHPDTLILIEEEVRFHREGYAQERRISLGSAGSKEIGLNRERDSTAVVIRRILSQCRVFQFHDTSESSYIRKMCPINNNRNLYNNAGNLAAYLYFLQESHPSHFERIVETVKQVASHFGGFVLAPQAANSDWTMLEWKETGSPYAFGPHQISDGLLRFIALATLFLQPEDSLPEVIIIDEPELGLHPYAITVLAAFIKKASFHSQIILATQSMTLLDQFDPEDIVVVERLQVPEGQEHESSFKRLEGGELQDWLSEYSLGELWEKNVLGGTP